MRSASKSTILLLYCTCITIFSGFARAQTDTEKSLNIEEWYKDYASSQYVVQLPLSKQSLERLKRRRLHRFQIIYLPPEYKENNVVQLRIGYFGKQEEAQEFLDSTRFQGPQEVILKITPEEHRAVIRQLANPEASSEKSGKYHVFNVTTGLTADSNALLLAEAKQLYMDDKFAPAQNIYSVISIFGDEASAAWAAELMGLCHEKLGQFDEAILSYENVLAEYPFADGTARVEQRLRGLQTASRDKSALRKRGNGGKYAKRYSFRGMLGQFQRQITRSLGDGESEDVLSSLTTDFNLSGNGRWEDHEAAFRTNGYWIKDGLDDDNSALRVRRAHLDYTHKKSGTSLSLGRQREFDSGVYTSFDGLSVTYPVLNNLTVGAAGGKPQYYSEIHDDFDLTVYSVFANWTLNRHWDINSYFTTETLGEVSNREAFGLRTQYASRRFLSSLNLDYDLAFSELNSFLWNGQYEINAKSGINFNYARQRSPFLTASNILIGQLDLDLELYLRTQQNRDNLLNDALARTSINDYLSLTYSYQINADIDVFLDYYQSSLSDIPSSGFLSGLETDATEVGEFKQQSIGTRVVAQRIFYGDDIATFGIKQNTGDNSSALQLYVSEKIRLANRFYINPKILYADTELESSDSTQSQLRFSLFLTYKPFRNTEIYLEGGNESISWTGPQNSVELKSNYVFFGYRVSLY